MASAACNESPPGNYMKDHTAEFVYLLCNPFSCCLGMRPDSQTKIPRRRIKILREVTVGKPG